MRRRTRARLRTHPLTPSDEAACLERVAVPQRDGRFYVIATACVRVARSGGGCTVGIESHRKLKSQMRNCSLE